MQTISYNKSKKKKLIEELLFKIENLNYYIVLRNDFKNKNFMRKYRIIDKKDAKAILNKISIDNLFSIEYDDNVIKYGPEEVIIFHIDCKLIDFHGEENKVKVYVKIKNKENNMPVISLHECEK